MEIFNAIFLGIVQGATEFLPVSSSGHLFLAEKWLGLESSVDLMIVTHLATLGAVLVVFWRQAWDLVQGFFCLSKQSLVSRKLDTSNAAGVLALKLGTATLITVGVALLIEPFFDELLTVPLVAGTLIFTGGLIVVAEKFRRAEGLDFTWAVAASLGVVQGIAVVPGISRSGITIAFLILLGLNRRRSAELSFLLSIPTILAAGVFLWIDSGGQFVLTSDLALAMAAAFLTALLMIYSMLRLIEKHWIWFAPYCVLLGAFLLFF